MTSKTNTKTEKSAPDGRKRLRTEPQQKEGDEGIKRAQKKLPFVSPERRTKASTPAVATQAGRQRLQASTTRTPLPLEAAGRPGSHAAIPSPVREQMKVTKRKIRSSIGAQKNEALSLLERQYQALRERVIAEIAEAEDQFKVLQQTNNSINEKVEQELKALAELAETEMAKIDDAQSAAISSSAQLYAKEKQKILVHFDAEIDALTG